MTKVKKMRMWVIGAAIGLMAALLIVPTTRGMLILHLGVLGFGRNPVTNPKPISEIASSHPNDFQIQLAAAHPVFPPGEDSNESGTIDAAKLTALDAFEKKFPNNPSTYANVLRWLSGYSLCSRRPENELIQGNAPVPSRYPAPPTTIYVFYDKTAEVGERLDPSNAYFPFMRAVGLFGSNRDSEALAELHKSAMDSKWQEYYEDEVYGLWKTSEIQYGTRNALARTAISASILFPQYASLRSVSRVAIYTAMTQEQAGHINAGLATRCDVIRTGALMRAQSRNLIGSLVGMAISTIGTENPGGIVKKYNTNSTNVAAVGRQRLSAFCTYLSGHGHADLAAAVSQEYQNGVDVKHIISNSNIGLVELQKLVKSVMLWTIDLVMLAAVIVLLLSGAVSTAVKFWPKLFELHPAARAVIAVTAVGLLIWLSSIIFQAPPSTFGYPGLDTTDSPNDIGFNATAVASLELLPSLVVVILCLAVSMTSAIRSGQHGIGAAARAFGNAVVGCAAVLIVVQTAYFEMMRCYAVGATGDQQNSMILVVVSLGILTVPILIVMISAVVSIKDKIPIGPGIVSGVSAWAAPVACVLLIVYGCSFLITIKSDEKLNENVEQIVTGEGIYYAQTTGQHWPAPLTWPTQSAKSITLQKVNAVVL